jgi:hypothetical protein
MAEEIARGIEKSTLNELKFGVIFFFNLFHLDRVFIRRHGNLRSLTKKSSFNREESQAEATTGRQHELEPFAIGVGRRRHKFRTS